MIFSISLFILVMFFSIMASRFMKKQKEMRKEEANVLIKDLPIRSCAKKSLEAYGIIKIKDLNGKSVQEILGLKYIGEKTYIELVKAFEIYKEV